jgi:hypothetical protein
VARLTNNEDVCDFAALEVQSVYFSGKTVRPVLDDYLRTGLVAESSERRLDYRSSAQKRLIPQLSLKVPVFRRWGKKFFVAVDDLFYDHLPISKTVNTLANSEVTWVVYPFSKTRTRFTMGRPRVVFTLWEDVLTALREGQEPTPEEIISQISEKKAAYRSLRV